MKTDLNNLEYTSPFLVRGIFAAGLISFVLHRMASTVADPDLWGYLSFGRLLWQTKAFPYDDVFSFVPTLHPWVYHEWLTGAAFYFLHQAFGPAALQLVKYALGLGALALMYLTARQRGADRLSSALGVLLVHGLMRMAYSPVRAQMFTYFFFSLTFYLLERSRLSGRHRKLWMIFPIQILWCNLHGGFLAGLGLVALYALGEGVARRPCRHYWYVLLLSAVSTIANPYGIGYWKYLMDALFMPRPEIAEWVSVLGIYRSNSAPLSLLYLGLLAGFAGIWCIRRREVTAVIALGVTLFLGLMHQRHQVLFCILMGAYLPDLLPIYLKELRARIRLVPFLDRHGLQITLVCALAITILNTYLLVGLSPFELTTPPTSDQYAGADGHYPLGAVEYIRRNQLSGNVLAHFDWGEYLIWTLFPRCRVGLDGRFETVYPESVRKDYFDFLFARSQWDAFVSKYCPDMILIDCRSETYAKLVNQQGWQRVYLDAGSALFVRKH